MDSMDTEVGFEVLAQANQVRVSRFSVRIRVLHWFNALMILSLYYLGIHQLFELAEINLFPIEDSRPMHFFIGNVWAVGVLSLVVFSSIKTSGVKESISTEKLIVKQRVFLVASMILMSLMAITGLTMYWLRDFDMPNLRSTLLFIHDVIAFSYLPILLFHLYLAIVHMESRQSLRTMFRDVYIKYLIHNEIDDLECYLTNEETVVFLHAEVLQISLLGFQAILPLGQWQEHIDLYDIRVVDFIHPELDKPLRARAEMDFCQTNKKDVFVKFRFTTSINDTSKLLLSKAIFFRKLFLSRRTHPRVNCSIPIEIETSSGTYVGLMANVAFGGAGFLLPAKLEEEEEVILGIKLQHPEVEFVANGCVVVSDKISSNDWCYGVSFSTLTAKQHLELTKIIGFVRLQDQRRVQEQRALR